MQKKKCTAIVLAAGQGRRMGTKTQKQYLEIIGKPVLCYSLEVFQESEIIDEIILVVGKGQETYCKKEIVEKYQIQKVKKIVTGGEERYHSVWNGLKEVYKDGALQKLLFYHKHLMYNPKFCFPLHRTFEWVYLNNRTQ